jgi:hypothetical protein
MAGVLPPTPGEVLEDLRRSAQALGEYRRQVVLVGGLVPLCYRRLFDPEGEVGERLYTYDVDWAVPTRLPRTEPRLAELIERAGYRVVFSQQVAAPVGKFQHARFGEAPPVLVDFLTDREGGRETRDGRDATTVQVQGGLLLEALPYVRLLLDGTLAFDLRQLAELGLARRLVIQLPHPANYVLQKLLAAEQRPQKEKRAKDWANVYEVALITRERWPGLGARMAELRAGPVAPAGWLRQAARIAREKFSAASQEGPVAIARLLGATSMPVREETVFQTLHPFLVALGLATSGGER